MSLFKEIYIVGAGLFGAVVAERLAAGRIPCIVLEKRNHIGGNCASHIDGESGIEVHSYGSHIFHTSDAAVWEYINRFTAFNDYRHHVEIRIGNQIYPMPISLATFSAFFRKAFSPREARDFIRTEQNGRPSSNLEEKAVSLIGRTLYETFIRDYTKKQWGCDPKELPPEIITRLPVRFNYNTRYFEDTFEGIPLEGYDRMFRNMFADPLIELRLNCDFYEIRKTIPESALIIYSGPIDQFYNYSMGRLNYRYVRFEQQCFDFSDYQGNSVVNYGDADVPFMRIHEFRHYHPERKNGEKTVIFKEFSSDGAQGGEMAYPVNTQRNQELLSHYRKFAAAESNVIFGGRLGSYRYWDMDDTIAAALKCFEEQVKTRVME